MNGIGEGIAFAGLCLAAAWVNVGSGEIPWPLWLFIAFWAAVSDWGQKEK